MRVLARSWLLIGAIGLAHAEPVVRWDPSHRRLTCGFDDVGYVLPESARVVHAQSDAAEIAVGDGALVAVIAPLETEHIVENIVRAHRVMAPSAGSHPGRLDVKVESDGSVVVLAGTYEALGRTPSTQVYRVEYESVRYGATACNVIAVEPRSSEARLTHLVGAHDAELRHRRALTATPPPPGERGNALQLINLPLELAKRFDKKRARH